MSTFMVQYSLTKVQTASIDYKYGGPILYIRVIPLNIQELNEVEQNVEIDISLHH